MIDLGRVRLLVAVAESGSVSGAARALSYSPSAVSQQLRALERECGAKLVERRGRRIELNDAGLLLAERGRDLLRRAADAEHALHALLRLELGVVRFGWFSTAGTSLVAPAARAFRDRHPEITLSLVETSPEQAMQMLLEAELDLAVVHEFELVRAPADRRFDREPLLEDVSYVGLPPGHRLAGRARVRLAELAEEAWIQGVAGGPALQLLPSACRMAGFEPRIVCQTNQHEVLQALVANGIGVGLVPRMITASVRPDVVVRPLVEPTTRRSVTLIRDAARQPSRAVEAFAAAVRVAAAASP